MCVCVCVCVFVWLTSRREERREGERDEEATVGKVTAKCGRVSFALFLPRLPGSPQRRCPHDQRATRPLQQGKARRCFCTCGCCCHWFCAPQTAKKDLYLSFCFLSLPSLSLCAAALPTRALAQRCPRSLFPCLSEQGSLERAGWLSLLTAASNPHVASPRSLSSLSCRCCLELLPPLVALSRLRTAAMNQMLQSMGGMPGGGVRLSRGRSARAETPAALFRREGGRRKRRRCSHRGRKGERD